MCPLMESTECVSMSVSDVPDSEGSLREDVSMMSLGGCSGNGFVSMSLSSRKL